MVPRDKSEKIEFGVLISHAFELECSAEILANRKWDTSSSCYTISSQIIMLLPTDGCQQITTETTHLLTQATAAFEHDDNDD